MKTAMTLLGSSKGAAESLFRLIRIALVNSGEKFSWVAGIGLCFIMTTATIISYRPDYIIEHLSFVSNLSQIVVSNTNVASPAHAQLVTDEAVNSEDQMKHSSLFEFNPEHRPYPETYSFKYTSLGFGMKDLKFIQELSRNESEQKVLNMLPKRFRKKAKMYIKPVMIISEKYQIDPLWVLSVMWTESHFRPTAISHVGAQGLMQIMPATKKYLLKKIKDQGHKLEVEKSSFDVRDFFPEVLEISDKVLIKKLVNIELGVVYLKNLLKLFNYNHRYATVAYNMGPGWTLKRLRSNLPVGVKNQYLEKVRSAYQTMAMNL